MQLRPDNDQQHCGESQCYSGTTKTGATKTKSTNRITGKKTQYNPKKLIVPHN